jgi:branched-chain amino acid transport system permease protein
VIYGSVLVLIVMFAPRGLAGIGRSVRDAWRASRGTRDDAGAGK